MRPCNSSKRYEYKENEFNFPEVITEREQRDSDVGENKILHQEIYQFTKLMQQTTRKNIHRNAIINNSNNKSN